MNRLVYRFAKTLVLVTLSTLSAQASIIVEVESASSGQSDGSITVTAEGTAGPFLILLCADCSGCDASNNLGSSTDRLSGSFTFDQLAAGSYCVKTVDRFGCETIDNVEVPEDPAECDIEIIVTEFEHVSLCDYCTFGLAEPCDDDGLISVDIRTDFSSYDVVWTLPNGESSNLENLTGLGTGKYILNVTTSNGDCVAEQVFEIAACVEKSEDELQSGQFTCRDDFLYSFGAPTIIELRARGSVDAAECTGAVTADIQNLNNLSVFYWEDEDGEKISSNGFVNDLCPGNYYVVLKNGCDPDIREQIEVADCSANPLVLDVSPCSDLRYQDYEFEVSGGVPPYQEEWIRVYGETSDRTLIVTDQRGCSVSHTFEHEEVNFDVTVLVTRPLNFGNSGGVSGFADITITNDSPPFTLSMSGVTDYRYNYSGQTKTAVVPDLGIHPGPPVADHVNVVPFTIVNADGCVYEGEIEIDDCDDIDVFHMVMAPVEGHAYDMPCTGTHDFNVIATSHVNDGITYTSPRGERGPFELRIVMVESYDNEPLPWERTYSFDELPPPGFLFEDLPSGKFAGFLRDFCDNGEWREELLFNTCKPCDRRRGIYFEQENQCVGSLNDGKVKLKINEDELEDFEFPITITWWDGSVTTLTKNGNSIERNGINEILNIDKGDYNVIYDFGDGCPQAREFRFGDDEDDAVGFRYGYRMEDFGEPWGDAYFMSYKCSGCLADEPVKYLESGGGCTSTDNWEAMWFEYFPGPDPDGVGPCQSGGFVLMHGYDEAGNVSVRRFDVPAGKSIGQSLGNKTHIFINGSFVCTNTDLCLFESIDIIGVELSRDMVLMNCHNPIPEDVYNDYVASLPDATPTNNCADCTLPNRCFDGICAPPCSGTSCPDNQMCVNGVCVSDAEECVEPCFGDQICGNGACRDPFCNFVESVEDAGPNAPNRRWTLGHTMKVGDTFTVTYCTSNAPDKISIEDDLGELWTSGCVPTGACMNDDGTPGPGRISESLSVRSEGALIIRIDVNCQNGIQEENAYYIRISNCTQMNLVDEKGGSQKSFEIFGDDFFVEGK